VQAREIVVSEVQRDSSLFEKPLINRVNRLMRMSMARPAAHSG